MNYWRSLQITILAVLFGSAVFILGKSVIDPKVAKPDPILPKSASLPEWEFRSTNPILNSTASDPDDTKPQHSRLISGRIYHFKQNQQSLDLEIRYLGETDGDVKKILRQYKSIFIPNAITKDSSILHQRDGIGSYIIFTQAERINLSACINPSGNSSVTRNQFESDRNNYDLQFGRILAWLKGEAELREQSCLWVNISSPIKNDSDQSRYQLVQDLATQNLEAAWGSWYRQNSLTTNLTGNADLIITHVTQKDK
jgi:cyanosortase A-associated protein